MGWFNKGEKAPVRAGNPEDSDEEMELKTEVPSESRNERPERSFSQIGKERRQATLFKSKGMLDRFKSGLSSAKEWLTEKMDTAIGASVVGKEKVVDAGKNIGSATKETILGGVGVLKETASDIGKGAKSGLEYAGKKIKGAASEGAESLSFAASGMKETYRSAKEDVQSGMKYTRGKMIEVKDLASQKYDELKGRGQEAFGKMKNKLREWKLQMEESRNNKRLEEAHKKAMETGREHDVAMENVIALQKRQTELRALRSSGSEELEDEAAA